MKKKQLLLATVCAMTMAMGGLPVHAQTMNVNQPKTPFSVQVSSSGSGIAGVYRLNGPTDDGVYVGVYGASSSSSAATDTSRMTLGGWVGTRQRLNNGLYFAYGIEGYSRSGKVANNTIENGCEGGPFVSIHKYFSENWYVTVFNNPIYMTTETVSGVKSTSTTFFAGGVGLGYQF